MNNIHVKLIPGTEQRYDTLGDWYYDANGDLIIAVTKDSPHNPTEESQMLVAVHELVEVLLCRKNKISQKMVDDFDFSFDGDNEPGDDPAAPYRHEHRFAMIVEHMLAHELRIEGYGVIK